MVTHHKLKDEELIRMYLRTQQNGYFETLYNRYVSKVYRRCLSLTKDSAKAEDFTHDIFIRVYGNLINFKEHSAFSTWLYSISYNYCMDQLRYANRLPTVELAQESDNHWIDNAESELLEMQLQHLTQVMRTISPDELQMLRMKYEEGMDIKEIAQQLDLRDSAVKMRLKRTRDKIRKLFTEQEY
ncbi:RNA polymerase sigma factor [Spirosoma sp. KUDC1026]|uniref:RNA polymerase sigma factor n=1 Tax=Spirosoma sp. KUDC1026 TaxID=2745947 RepID=UPI00159B9AB7|nr:RNA polymerase sigma factor [Spirosoma sp. KUDC1026]QKZ14000.1 RNA polymerase sigma factor [Spirosoma sp. KUDC1026]